MTENIDKSLNTHIAAEPPRKRGRPRKLPEMRDAAVEQTARPGRATALGRDGKILSRRLHGSIDKFAIPPNIVPPGWTYEWKRKTLAGLEDTDHLNGLAENGWTPVPASRHAGTFMITKQSGEIVRDGLILMERPASLTQEARAEESAAARAQIQAQNDQYRGRMPSGMSTEHPGVRANVRTTYEQSPSELRPSHQVMPE